MALMLLLTAFLLSGFSCQWSLMTPADGQEVNCTALVHSCWPERIVVTNSSTLEIACSNQTNRRICYDALPERCKNESLDVHGRVLVFDFHCQKDHKEELGRYLDGCIGEKRAIIFAKHKAACVMPGNNSHCSDIALFINCTTEGLDDCCPEACHEHLGGIQQFFVPRRRVLGCPPTQPYVCGQNRTRTCQNPSGLSPEDWDYERHGYLNN